MLKHPCELNCSRELGHKTKTYSFKPSFLLYFFLIPTPFFSVPFLYFSLSSSKFKLPRTLFLPLFFFFFFYSLVITGSIGGLIPWDGFVNLLVYFLRIRLVLAQFLELRDMHQHMHRDG